jgi:hypothetical protein
MCCSGKQSCGGAFQEVRLRFWEEKIAKVTSLYSPFAMKNRENDDTSIIDLIVAAIIFKQNIFSLKT